MDGISNSRYRNIIERAAFMGLITEESKPLYLSTIPEDNTSDLSELDSYLNRDEATNTRSLKKMKDKKSEILKILNDVNNNIDKEIEMRALNNDSCLSNLSGDTIENYSILDISNGKIKSDFTGTETDDSLVRPNNVSNSKHLVQSFKVMTQVRKNPRKNQIIDFNIPIYTENNKKKSSVKPNPTHIYKAVQYEVSGTKCKPIKCSSKHEQKEKSLQCPKKWSISKSDHPTVNGKRNTVSPLINIYKHSCTHINQSNKPIAEVNVTALQESDELKKKHLLYACPSQKEDSDDLFNDNSTVHLQDGESDWDKSAHLHTNKNTILRNQRKLKFRTDLVNQDYTIRIKPQMDSNAPECFPHTKTRFKKRTFKAKHTETCTQCKCKGKSNQHALNYDSTTDTASGDGISVRGIPLTKSVPKEEYERYLNLNIICQFYEDEERNNQNGIQVLQSLNDTSTEAKEVKHKAVPVKSSTEKEKTKQFTAIRRLSKFFTNRNTKKK